MEPDMKPEFLLKGLIIGFSIAAPIGPIGVLCIRRTLAEGFLPGLTAGLGAATADAVYGAVAAFGLTAITSFLVGRHVALGIIGGLFLCALGCRIFFSKPALLPGRTNVSDESAHPDPSDRIHDEMAMLTGGYVSTFFLTITSPITILLYVSVFAGAGLVKEPEGYGSACLLVAGVFCGSALWWLVLSGTTSIFRKMITARVMRAVNYLAGVAIAGFGAYAIWSVL
jgi:threonine/homoserine/homoserine lactone efflux protein